MLGRIPGLVGALRWPTRQGINTSTSSTFGSEALQYLSSLTMNSGWTLGFFLDLLIDASIAVLVTGLALALFSVMYIGTDSPRYPKLPPEVKTLNLLHRPIPLMRKRFLATKKIESSDTKETTALQ